MEAASCQVQREASPSAQARAFAASPAPWTEPRLTAVLVLADGTAIEGALASAATGEASGEICFNTAMTGYEEILTDPSYAGQIVTFTFPHIGNVGVNDEDIETVNMAVSSGVRGVVLAEAITEPSNWRVASAASTNGSWRAASWASAASIRARLTALIREKGMPNARRRPSSRRRVRRRRARVEGQGVAFDDGARSRAARRLASSVKAGTRPNGRGRKAMAASGEPRLQRRRHRLRREAQHLAAARRARLQGHGRAADHEGRGRCWRCGPRWRVPRQWARRSGGDGRIRRSGDQPADARSACRPSASASATRSWRSPSAARPRR